MGYTEEELLELIARGDTHQPYYQYLLEELRNVRKQETPKLEPAKPLLQVRLDPGARPVQTPKIGDVGFDLHVSATTTIPAHGFADIPSGVRVALPDGWWGMLTGRSSTIRNRGLLVVQGIIDTGYTGELFSAVWNLTDQDVTVEKGDRIAQLILLPNIANKVEILHTDWLPETARGEKGFGSSGK